ncbi:alpha/beta hydrolase family protein [Kribbella kalugense]|uniref:Alpha/beta hydrolase family protein n=1 Tax=Kribbella kalugense TaxID=2512221 RepID=A0A4R7ZUR1_9ACTN|nr:alpha/beta fold hydrolase [Kribbella kalugense]TDW19310.1 alpha/beta hydrolase family protein [Kribbella kalugense]
MSEDRSVLTRTAREPDEELKYGGQADQVIDYWHAKEYRPLVVFVHGGFWRPEYDRVHARPHCAALSDLGWPVLSLEYRRTPGDPDVTTTDIRTALDALPDLVDVHAGYVLMGHSAGGQLALWAASTLNPVRLRAVLALAPVADLLLADRLELDGGAVQAFIGGGVRNDLDPVHLPPSIAPVSLVHGVNDSVVPLRVTESYFTAHPTARFLRVEHSGHYQLIDPRTEPWHEVTTELTHLTN